MSFLLPPMFLTLIVPLVGGIALIIKSRGRGLGFPSCGGCQYNLTGTIGAASRCPECGAEFVNVGIVPPNSQRNRPLFWIGVSLLLVPSTCVGLTLVSAMTYGRAQQSAAAAQQQSMAAQQLQQQQAAAATQSQTAATAPSQSTVQP